MAIAYLVIIILLANKLLFVTPFSYQASDLGVVLIGIGLLYYARRSRELNRLSTFFSWYVFVYLTFVLMQASIAAFKYGQPVIHGVIGARDQFYYLSFPLFVLALNSAERASKLMQALTAVAAIIIFLALIHNLGIVNVFIDRGGEEWKMGGERFGVIRFWFPGLDILMLTGIWQFMRYLKQSELVARPLGVFLIILAGVLLRQTRGRIIALFAVLGLMAYRHKRYRLIAMGAFAFILLALVVTLGGKENILVNAFTSAYTEVAEGEGTWVAREQQIDIAKQILQESFWFGSGAIALRGVPHTTDFTKLNMATLVYAADLGYWTWIKFYGFPGIVLLALMLLAFFWYGFKRPRKPEWEDLVQLGIYHYLCIAISLITINYLTSSGGIVLLCLTWALLANGTEPRNKNPMLEKSLVKQQ